MRPIIMNNKICFIFFLIIIVSFISYCGKSTGNLTIVNTTLESAKVSFDGKDIALQSEQHYTHKGIKPGIYILKIGANPPLKIEIKKNKTTLVDLSGKGCFAVADYSAQYDEKGDGTVKVKEKFINKKSFITSDRLTAELGEQLPANVKHNENIYRLHRIDCSWIDNDQAIIDAIANLP